MGRQTLKIEMLSQETRDAITQFCCENLAWYWERFLSKNAEDGGVSYVEFTRALRGKRVAMPVVDAILDSLYAAYDFREGQLLARLVPPAGPERDRQVEAERRRRDDLYAARGVRRDGTRVPYVG